MGKIGRQKSTCPLPPEPQTQADMDHFLSRAQSPAAITQSDPFSPKDPLLGTGALEAASLPVMKWHDEKLQIFLYTS